MRRLKSALFVSITAVALALPGAALALEAPTVTITGAELISRAQVRVSGTFTCPAGAITWAVYVSVAQGRNTSNRDAIWETTCSGGPQSWVLDVSGGPFHHGWVDVAARGTCSGPIADGRQEPCTEGTATARLHI
jgi:hypothetical protein